MADGGAGPKMQAFEPGKDTAREFRHALGRFATGVCVVTTDTGEGPLGITANSFASVSLDPPLVLWAPARASRRFDAFAGAEHYAIHVLGADQDALSHRFSRAGDDFSGLDWAAGPGGAPLIAGCLARFACTRVAQHDGGDHLIVVGRVTGAEYREGAPLLFSAGRYGGFACG